MTGYLENDKIEEFISMFSMLRMRFSTNFISWNINRIHLVDPYSQFILNRNGLVKIIATCTNNICSQKEALILDGQIDPFVTL